MSAPWKKLHLSRTTGSPPLLYKYISTSTSYELYVTDLTNIWSEHMSRQAIWKRADKDDATIDPSEDPQQFGLLLQKISDALQHAPGSSTTLHHRSSGSLELTTSIKLPAPLEPLRWTLYLSKEQPSSTTAHLLLPLIEAEVDRESRQKTLIDQLHKKDWILAKLFDKIEAVGIDLSTIFPGISGLRSSRKGTTLAQAAKYIKGVAPFDEQAWLNEASKSSPGVDLASNILAEISGTGGTESAGKLHPPPDAWWEEISTIEDHADRSSPSQRETPKPQPKVSNDDLEMETDSGGETDDDEFQRQETPPRLKRPQATREKSPVPTEKNQGTNDEPVEKSPLPERQKPPSKQPKSLGVIGGKKQLHQAPPKSPPAPERDVTTKKSSQTHDQNDLLTDEDKTDSGPDGRAASPSPPATPKHKQQAQKPSVKPRGLGVIGGKKKKEANPAPAQSTSPTSLEDEPRGSSIEKSPLPATRTKGAGKLGVIGGKASKATTDTVPLGKPSPPRRAEEDTEMSETAKAKPEPAKPPSVEKETRQTQEEPKKEETEQERADRRREELKRQLEAKAKAPVKKKRKF